MSLKKLLPTSLITLVFFTILLYIFKSDTKSNLVFSNHIGLDIISNKFLNWRIILIISDFIMQETYYQRLGDSSTVYID